MKKRIVLSVSVLALTVAVAIGGTLAYLTAKTDTVKNTFTVGHVAITLNEAPLNTDGKTLNTTAERITTGNSYQMVPGSTYGKDPLVTVAGDSEDCYVFIKVTETGNLAGKVNDQDVNYFTYDLADGWEKLDNVADVYYRTVNKQDTVKAFPVLKDDQVTVSSDVTTEMMEAIEKADAVQPTLAFTAYAVQSANVKDVAAAWGEVSK